MKNTTLLISKSRRALNSILPEKKDHAFLLFGLFILYKNDGSFNK